MVPTPGMVILPLVMPRLRPVPSVLIEVEAVMMFWPVPPKLVPPIVLRPVLPRPLRSCHWMPNSAARSALSSTIRASIWTWARRRSSMAMTFCRLLKTGSGAVMISELLATSACTMLPGTRAAPFWLLLSFAQLLPALLPVAAFCVLNVLLPVFVLLPPDGVLPVRREFWPAALPLPVSLPRMARSIWAMRGASACFR